MPLSESTDDELAFARDLQERLAETAQQSGDSIGEDDARAKLAEITREQTIRQRRQFRVVGADG